MVYQCKVFNLAITRSYNGKWSAYRCIWNWEIRSFLKQEPVYVCFFLICHFLALCKKISIKAQSFQAIVHCSFRWNELKKTWLCVVVNLFHALFIYLYICAVFTSCLSFGMFSRDSRACVFHHFLFLCLLFCHGFCLPPPSHQRSSWFARTRWHSGSGIRACPLLYGHLKNHSLNVAWYVLFFNFFPSKSCFLNHASHRCFIW